MPKRRQNIRLPVTTIKTEKSEEQRDEIAKILASDNVEALVKLTEHVDAALQIAAIQKCGTLISSQKEPPIDDLIVAGIVPILVRCLSEANPTLQKEATSVLKNITAGTSSQINRVKKDVAVSSFIQILTANQEEVLRPAVWALYSIAGDTPELRDYVINMGVLRPLISLIKPDINISLLRVITMTIYVLCRGNPPMPVELTNEILSVLNELMNHDNIDVLIDTLEAISKLAEGGSEQIHRLIIYGIVPKLIRLLSGTEEKVQALAIKNVGIIVAGTPAQAQVVLDCGALTYFPALLRKRDRKITKEVVRCISNIIAREKQQVVIDSGLMGILLEELSKNKYRDKEVEKIVKVLGKNAEANTQESSVQLAEVQQCDKLGKPLKFIVMDKLLKRDSTPQKVAAEMLEYIIKEFDPQKPKVAREQPSGAIPRLIQLLESPIYNVCSIASVSLGTIIQFGRLSDLDIVEVAKSLLCIVRKDDLAIFSLQQVVTNITFLCYEILPHHIIYEILLVLNKLVTHSDTIIIKNTANGIAGLLFQNRPKYQMIINSGIMPKIIKLLSLEPDIQIEALRVVNRLIELDDDHNKQYVLNCGLLAYFPWLLFHQDKDIHRNAVQCLRYITASNSLNAQAVIDAGLLQIIVEELNKEEIFYDNFELVCIVNNILDNGSKVLVITLVHGGLLPPLCNLLNDGMIHSFGIILVLDCIYLMLRACWHTVVTILKECGGLDKINALQSHHIYRIQHRSIKIYWLCLQLTNTPQRKKENAVLRPRIIFEE